MNRKFRFVDTNKYSQSSNYLSSKPETNQRRYLGHEKNPIYFNKLSTLPTIIEKLFSSVSLSSPKSIFYRKILAKRKLEKFYRNS